jgi:hypothetical protein
MRKDTVTQVQVSCKLGRENEILKKNKEICNRMMNTKGGRRHNGAVSVTSPG